MELLFYYSTTLLLTLSLQNPVPPLALPEAWRECVVNAEGTDMSYVYCDIQFDPYEILSMTEEREENDGR